MSEQWIRWFDTLGMDDVPLVGGKNASLGELKRALEPKGVRLADGFATTADAYRAFLRGAALEPVLDRALGGLDVGDLGRLREAGHTARAALLAAELPAPLADAVRAAYRRMEAEHGAGCDVAVRSSATAEDLPEASFAGQQETFLNVRGEPALLDAVRRCFASLFTDRAIVYRAERGFAHGEVALSVGVQKMVRSDLGGAGVMFSLDPESGFRDVVVINAAWGLGESVVQGSVNPDEYTVFKPTLRQGFRPLLQRRLGSKEMKLVYDVGRTRTIRPVPVGPEDRARFVLDEDEILTLARWAILVEDHYSERRGVATPMDMEWAKDGRTGELFLLQARPETVHAARTAW
jgi:pyruvate, water dikinase